MQFPAFMPKELRYAETVNSDEELFSLLVAKPIDLILFFETASDDETWSDRHDVFMLKALEWLTTQAYFDKLDQKYIARIAAAVRKHYPILRGYLPQNISIKLKDGDTVLNGLMLASASNFFKQILVKECRDKGVTSLSFPSSTVRDFSYLEFFISAGTVPELATMGQDEIIALIRRSGEWGMDALSKVSEKMLAKYLNNDNIVPMLFRAKQEGWLHFQVHCAEFFNRHYDGFKIYAISLERLAFEFLDFHEDTLRYYALLRPLITDLICHGDLTEDPHFGLILKQMSNLVALDISHTTAFTDQLLEIPRGLKILNLSECPWISRDTLKQFLGLCPELKQMSLSSDIHLNFTAWGELAKFKQLRILDLSQCHQIQDGDLGVIVKGCGALTELSLNNCTKIGEKGFLDLAKSLPRLTHLNLSRCAVSDTALVEIASRCRTLSILDISSCDQLTEKGILALVKQATALQELNISRCRVNAPVIEEIKKIAPLLSLES